MWHRIKPQAPNPNRPLCGAWFFPQDRLGLCCVVAEVDSGVFVEHRGTVVNIYPYIWTRFRSFMIIPHMLHAGSLSHPNRKRKCVRFNTLSDHCGSPLTVWFSWLKALRHTAAIRWGSAKWSGTAPNGGEKPSRAFTSFRLWRDLST